MSTQYGGSGEEAIELLDVSVYHLWGLAIVFFGIGDVVSTVVGLNAGGLAEVGPLVAPIIEAYGLVALIGLKVATFGICYFIWRVTPHPHRLGVPLGLGTLGLLVTAWNTALILLVI